MLMSIGLNALCFFMASALRKPWVRQSWRARRRFSLDAESGALGLKLITCQRDIARFIHAQMQAHYWDAALCAVAWFSRRSGQELVCTPKPARQQDGNSIGTVTWVKQQWVEKQNAPKGACLLDTWRSGRDSNPRPPA